MQRAKTYSLVADDLLVISHGNHTFVSIIKDALNEFSESSGLNQNMGKNTMLFGSVDAGEKQRILDILPFRIGKFPVRHLGIPLLYKNIGITDCKLCSLIGLLLPKATVKEINSLLKGFLWCHGKSCKGRAKVAWSVCFPKSEGGLGLKLLNKWNEVLLIKHIWKLVSNQEGLWVKW
ncbi:hypothetical protein Tco_0921190, partial [Tanacetum coccineum]